MSSVSSVCAGGGGGAETESGVQKYPVKPAPADPADRFRGWRETSFGEGDLTYPHVQLPPRI